MGLNNQNANRIVFDIETAPLPDAADYLDLSELTAPANYKDPAKIAAYIEEERTKSLSRCGLDVDLAQIVAVGWKVEGTDEHIAVTADTMDEPRMLKQFWFRVAESHIVGFNCLSFDIPMLLRRSAYLGVTVPDIQIDKYRHPRVTDLMQLLSFNGAVKPRSLAFYGKRFGVKAEDAHTGADIAWLVAQGNWAAVQAHVRADVQTTAGLAAKVIGFQIAEAVAA